MLARRILGFTLLLILLGGCTTRSTPLTSPPETNRGGPAAPAILDLSQPDEEAVPTAQERGATLRSPAPNGAPPPDPLDRPPAISATPSSGAGAATTPRLTATAPGTQRPLPALLSPQPTAQVGSDSCTLEHGQVISATLQTRLLPKPLIYRVYLPPCYESHTDQRYPSLYLFHGQSYTDDQWDRMGVDETADRLIAAGEIAPLVIVMPYERYGGQPTETGFSDAVVKGLIPTIDADFRTRPDRRFRAVGGLSRGAGWAIHFGFSYYAMFGRVGAHSAAVFHTDAQRMRTWLGKIPPEQYPQVYLDIGDRDRPEIMRSTQWFEDLLNLYDVPHEWHLFSGYHAEEYWSEHMEDYLLWYTRDW